MRNKYEVVLTPHFLDIGLCLERNSQGQPKEVRGRNSEYSYHNTYGMPNSFTINTGVYITEERWDLFCDHDSVEKIMRCLDIDKLKLARKFATKIKLIRPIFCSKRLCHTLTIIEEPFYKESGIDFYFRGAEVFVPYTNIKAIVRERI